MQLLVTVVACVSGAVQSFGADVRMGGYTIEHTHHQASERRISPENVDNLQQRWEHVTLEERGAKPVCPGGEGGGFQQALATDGSRISMRRNY